MRPPPLEAIEQDTQRLGFSMPSDRRVGALLRTLAAMKPNGRLLELGTGTGLSTAWLLDGMDEQSELDSIDNDAAVLEIARRHLDHDERIRFHECEGERFILQVSPGSYDLIFADAWPGKYHQLDETLALLSDGGCYVIDDMSPQPNWPDGHEVEVQRLLEVLEARVDLTVCRLEWATGVAVCSRAA